MSTTKDNNHPTTFRLPSSKKHIINKLRDGCKDMNDSVVELNDFRRWLRDMPLKLRSKNAMFSTEVWLGTVHTEVDKAACEQIRKYKDYLYSGRDYINRLVEAGESRREANLWRCDLEGALADLQSAAYLCRLEVKKMRSIHRARNNDPVTTASMPH